MQLRLPAHTPIGPLAVFFACLPAVETLTTDDTSAAYILNAKSEDASEDVFPALKAINLAEDQFAAYEEAGSFRSYVPLYRRAMKSGNSPRFVISDKLTSGVAHALVHLGYRRGRKIFIVCPRFAHSRAGTSLTIHIQLCFFWKLLYSSTKP
ncbi:hypothetical protein HYPSUDRAFT_36371 [Hypholoma sublateritium FD-334 SS-4]|uniref:Aminotransferase class I/classII domain-containing protein n=1 Tax=Hypholoma sublateritium (strain FD-334 SS-4) TaxID=945553 RepID=A0A0D2Q532_HYPSF|nr:hypothetical protein HYPSUDRAFT_36371 [Hypholoma sublateritium FD-334 SS-4]